MLSFINCNKPLQVAQLSQRDRAAGCVSFGQTWMERGYNILRTL